MKGYCIFRTNRNTGSALYTFGGGIHLFNPSGYTLGIVTPCAMQVTTFKKDDNTDTRPVIDGISFYIENQPVHLVMKINLLAAEQRGIIANLFIFRCKQRGIDPNDPTPAPPLQGEGTGGVINIKKNHFRFVQ
jgi:hypothetical protein